MNCLGLDLKKIVRVAIGLIDFRGKILVGWRTSDQHQGNKYEFPGGKIEADETAEQACRREIQEEVGVELDHLRVFEVLSHDYEDVCVELYFFLVTITAQQASQIQSPWQWVERQALADLNFPAANTPIIQRLNWPHFIKISHELPKQLERDRAVYVKALPEQATQLIETLNDEALDPSMRMIVNLDCYEKLPEHLQQQVFAIHLNQAQLMQAQQLAYLGQSYLAACHDVDSVKKAQALGVDAILLSPILPTATHPDAIPLGWNALQQASNEFSGLIYALGGQTPQMLELAQASGAYGVAGIRAF